MKIWEKSLYYFEDISNQIGNVKLFMVKQDGFHDAQWNDKSSTNQLNLDVADAVNPMGSLRDSASFRGERPTQTPWDIR